MEQASNGIARGIDMSSFDPDRIAFYETEGWRAYYDRNWPRAFGLMMRLIESQFHIPFPRSVLAAYYVVRASIAFAGKTPRRDVVLRCLGRFYRMAAARNQGAFDPRRAAELELRYWIVHRELVGQPDKRPFVEVVAELHATLFGATTAAMWASAESRVAAADAVDLITSRRSLDPAADWRRVEECLRQAYRQVKAHRLAPPHTMPAQGMPK